MDPGQTRRLRVTIRGAVQGVGFRPYVHRLATEIGLRGWVLNSSQGILLEVEGIQRGVDAFLLRLEKEKPPRSFIQSLEHTFLDPAGLTDFTIRESNTSGDAITIVLPDIATCPECVREIGDPTNRRYLYPFTNCTNCGPRFTIIESLPYDRSNTTMKAFLMCEDCRREYGNPIDRRFHAQPNACPTCGPHVELWNTTGSVMSSHQDALREAASAIRAGQIVAVKGVGGFQLLVDARNESAVIRLRQRKHREEKPFALMFPSLELVKAECVVSDLEERLLLSPESPIVLLERSSGNGHDGAGESSIALSVAPRNPYLGVMLPYTPLHHILVNDIGSPVVATSGNLSDEPICIDEHEALSRLAGIADLFLVHNRPIVRHVDDSVVRVMAGRELVMRRARGYAPLPIPLHAWGDTSILAVGAHLKNTVALTAGDNVFVGQHIGDLETRQAFEAFRNVIDDLQHLYKVRPRLIACDMHPDYLSTKHAQSLAAPVLPVQHHYAHVASCMAENELEGCVLGVSWDGTGYGPDSTIWGGEFLLTDDTSFERVCSFRAFKLPGGERAIKEPRRASLGVLYELYGDTLFEQSHLLRLQAFTSSELTVLRQMLDKGLNSPVTSSVGRLFDAVASMIGLRQRVAHEGQAAMELEFSVGLERSNGVYRFELSDFSSRRGIHGQSSSESESSSLPPGTIVDWAPMISDLLSDVQHGVSQRIIATKFHNTLSETIVAVGKRIGVERVVLTGGCFQNRYLTERTVCRLRESGFRPYWHQRVPPNDGGIALGQIFAAFKAQRRVTRNQQLQEEAFT